MKKALIILSLLLVTTNSNAQWFFGKTIKGNGNVITQTRNTKDYDAIKVSGFFDVILVKGEEGKIIVKAEDNLQKYVITEVDGDELVIKLKKGINLSTKKGIYITVPFEDIEQISLSGSGDVSTKNTISGRELDIKLSGSGDVNLDVDAKEVNSQITGSGDITLNGNTTYLDASVTGSGDFGAKNLKASNVTIRITGSGDANVYASDKIEAKVTGSGDIVFYGNPKIETTKVTGSGDISRR